MQLTTILVDDEIDSLETLKTELETYCPEVRVVATAQSAQEGISAIRKHQPDVVFLDIEMPNMNGLEMLESLGQIEFDVIFVTAYDQYAVNAFDFNALDYLLKPVLKSKLTDAVAKVEKRSSHRMDRRSLDALINHISVQTGTGIRNIALPTSDGFEFVELDHITHIQAESNYCWVFLESGAKHLLAKTLKQMVRMICGPQFFRPHQSFIVNLNYAKRYVRGQGGYIVMKDGNQIPVSRSHKDELLDKLRG